MLAWAEIHEFCTLSFRPTLVLGGVGEVPPHEVMTGPRQRVWARGRMSSMYAVVLPVVAMSATPGWGQFRLQATYSQTEPRA